MCIVSNLIPLLLLESYLNIGQISYFLQLTLLSLLSITWPLLFQHIHLYNPRSFSWEVPTVKRWFLRPPAASQCSPGRPHEIFQSPGAQCKSDESLTYGPIRSRCTGWCSCKTPAVEISTQVMKWQMIGSCKRPCWFFLLSLCSMRQQEEFIQECLSGATNPRNWRHSIDFNHAQSTWCNMVQQPANSLVPRKIHKYFPHKSDKPPESCAKTSKMEHTTEWLLLMTTSLILLN